MLVADAVEAGTHPRHRLRLNDGAKKEVGGAAEHHHDGCVVHRSHVDTAPGGSSQLVPTLLAPKMPTVFVNT